MNASVLGATGNIGRRVVGLLCEAGWRVRAFGRNRSVLDELERRGATAVCGSFDQPEAIEAALRGATAAFVMFPQQYDLDVQERLQLAIFEGVARSGVPHVVNLSSLGCHLTSSTTQAERHRLQEHRLSSISNCTVMHLRPGYFMENLLAQTDQIRENGFFASPICATRRFPMVASQDIAHAAFEQLCEGRSGALELLGPIDYSMADVEKELISALGRDVQYVELPIEVSRAHLRAQGVPDKDIEQAVQLVEFINAGLFASEHPCPVRSATPTSLRTFVRSWVAASAFCAIHG